MMTDTLWNDGKPPGIFDAEAKLAIATPLLMEVGENGLPDYGAWVTFERDGDGVQYPVVHHSRDWRPSTP